MCQHNFHSQDETCPDRASWRYETLDSRDSDRKLYGQHLGVQEWQRRKDRLDATVKGGKWITNHLPHK